MNRKWDVIAEDVYTFLSILDTYWSSNERLVRRESIIVMKHPYEFWRLSFQLKPVEEITYSMHRKNKWRTNSLRMKKLQCEDSLPTFAADRSLSDWKRKASVLSNELYWFAFDKDFKLDIVPVKKQNEVWVNIQLCLTCFHPQFCAVSSNSGFITRPESGLQ
mgnify:CR=1 FL=1